MLLRDHWESAIKEKTVQTGKFSVGAGMTAELMPKRFLAVSSKSVRRQLEQLGCRWQKV